SGSSHGFDIRHVADTGWTEWNLTYQNAPTIDANVAASSGRFAKDDWVSVDITNLVTGNGPLSLAVTTASPTNLSLFSRESGQDAPQLIVEAGSIAIPEEPQEPIAPEPPEAKTFPIRATFYYGWFAEAWKQ